MTAKRIFDDPDHPQYGPVRRMWVVLVQLDMLDAAERWSKHNPLTWDKLVAANCNHHGEAPSQRMFIATLLEGWV